jgi:hypothetical protein
VGRLVFFTNKIVLQAKFCVVASLPQLLVAVSTAGAFAQSDSVDQHEAEH